MSQAQITDYADCRGIYDRQCVSKCHRPAARVLKGLLVRAQTAIGFDAP